MKVGILGGGQLGRMLLQQAANYPVETYVLEKDKNCPAAHLCHHFVVGDITDFDAVYNFGKQVDALTIEIENVNIEALEKLEQEGLRVIPSTKALRTIKNKITQKEFYKKNGIPTANFLITDNKKMVKENVIFLPAVHKIAEGGYDGKGVVVLENKDDIDKAFDAPAVLEKKIKITKEIAIIIAAAKNGAIVAYPPTEMVFNPRLNLLDYQLSPANLALETIAKATQIAISIVQKLNSAGLFAIEFLIDNADNIWVNETAPRVHNSGHHTIESNECSQFDMLWRIILNYPLGQTASSNASILINLVGEDGFEGKPIYQGIEEVLQMPNVFLHLYGKTTIKPGRKMGHITILGNDLKTMEAIKTKLKLIGDKRITD